MIRKCDECGKSYDADSRNLKRGWGLCCSKSCAAKKREKNRPDYNPKTVANNNHRRDNWNNGLRGGGAFFENDYDPADSEYWDSKNYGN